MTPFAALFTALDQTTRTTQKVAALAAYLSRAPEADRLWTIALLSGRRPRRVVTSAQLRDWAAERAGLPMWLFEECYGVVGDLAETIALVLPEPARPAPPMPEVAGQTPLPVASVSDPPASDPVPAQPAPTTNAAGAPRSLADWMVDLRRLGTMDEAARKARVLDAWASLPASERFVFNKLLTGGFRLGVSQSLMTRALAQATGLPEAELAHRLMGDWTPETTSYATLVLEPDPEADLSKPYPFFLAHALEGGPEALEGAADGPGDTGHDLAAEWAAEWKWDGIRGQLVLRGGRHFLWSRGEELITDRFPEFAAARDFLPPGTVLDGEILAWDANAGDGVGAPRPFSDLQKRLGRKTVPKRLLAEAPAVFLAYDLLEWQGADWRARPYDARRAALESLVTDLPEAAPVRLSPLVPFADAAGLAALRDAARAGGTEGLILKRRSAPYRSGRKRGDWWKWKVDPLTVDAVLIYAQAGHGRRANLFTDFTFAVWDGADLMPVAKAYSGLTDAEFGEITAWVRKNTRARFGPVRQVAPEHVFEIAFEGIQVSPRHKSGIALRFPRMKRWRRDKPLSEANTLSDLQEMLEGRRRL